MTQRERQRAAEERIERRAERFVDDMYALPAPFSPSVLALTVVGLGGFLLTWGYLVAKPVVDAHKGAAGGASGDGAEELDK